jgi:Sulfotransferase family
VTAAASSGPGFLFLVGRGRSGTTLLRAMLDAHPQVSVAPEALFVMNAYRRYGRGPWNPARVEAFARDIWLERKLRTWDLDEADVADRLRAVATPSFAALCRAVYEEHARAHGKPGPRWVGDKNPHHALFVRELMATFPEARFLHIVRDYRDNILSYQGVRFDLRDAGALAYRWRRYNAAVLAAAESAPERFLRLRYEDLTADPKAELARVCDFLDLPFDPAMLRFHEAHRGEARDWHAGLAVPVDAARGGRWRDAMPPAQVAVAERICGALGGRLGYPASGARGGAGAALAAARGVAVGAAVTALERALFAFPMGVRSRVLAYYRLATGSLALDGRRPA